MGRKRVELARELTVRTYGGVCDLGRVIGVLALLELTPTALASRLEGDGLRIDLRIVGDARSNELCVKRLEALVCVASARVASEAAEQEGTPCACQTASL